MLQVTLSNQHEQLFTGLKDELLKRKPFELSLLIVPSSTVKSWVMRSLANDPMLQVAFGYKIVTLLEAVHCLTVATAKCSPNRFELAISIENELVSQSIHPSNALEIADLFLKYGEFIPNILELLPQDSWQLNLWKKLFGEDSHWQSLALFLQTCQLRSLPKQIHLFGFNNISLTMHHFMERLSKLTSFHAWIISPSRMLWSDLRTEKEALRNTLPSVNHGDNPLIANCAKHARRWRSIIEEIPYVKERFVMPQAAFDRECYSACLLDGIETFSATELSLLQAIQSDLLILRPLIPDQQLEISESQTSLEVHSAPSIQREVEVIYQTLLKAFKQGVQAKDVIVYVTNLKKYAPYIRTIFTQSEYPIPIEVADKVLFSDTSYGQLLFDIFALLQGDWEVKSLFALFAKSQMCLLHSQTLEEMRALQTLFKKQGIKKIFKDDWKELLQSLAVYVSAEEFMENPTLRLTRASLSYSQAEILGEFIENVLHIQQSLKPFMTSQRLPFKQWVEGTRALVQKNLRVCSKEDTEAEATLNKLFEFMLQLRIHEEISFSSFLHYFNEIDKSNPTTYREKHINAVRISSLSLLRIVPSQIVVMMGLDADHFPRKNLRSAFDCIEDKNSLPTNSYEDRYLFLESLLSARFKWILSYINTSQSSPSILIQELLQYLDDHYRINGSLPSEKLVFMHPQFNFDPKYFSEKTLTSFSTRAFKNAQIVQNPVQNNLGMAFATPNRNTTSGLRFIALQELTRALSNPLKYYLNRSLNVYLQNPSSTHSLFEELDSENLWESDWLKWALKYPIDRVLELAEQSGNLPISHWKNVVKKQLASKLEMLLQALKRIGISHEEFVEVEFSHGVSKPFQVDAKRWKFPIIEIDYRGQKVGLTGFLPYVCPKGLISFRSTKLENTLTSLPEWMFHKCLPDNFSSKEIHFLKLEEKMSHNCDTPSWDIILDHYFYILNQPTPLFPTWIKAIFLQNVEQLERAMTQTSLKEDPYIQWFSPQISKLQSKQILSDWKNHVDLLSKPLIELEAR